MHATRQRIRRCIGSTDTVRIAAGLCAAALALGACGGGSEGSADGGDVDALPVLSLQRDLHVGSVNDPDSGFSSIGSIAVGPDDLVYVAETQDKQVRVYDETGHRVRTIGRAGDGPGEFRGLGRMGFKGDTLWVCDVSSGRITLFSPQGDVFESIPGNGFWVPMSGDALGFLQESALRDDGRVAYGLFQVRFGRARVDTLVIPDVVGDRDGKQVDTLGYSTMVNPARRVTKLAGQDVPVPSAPSDATMRLHVPDGLVLVERTAPAQSGTSTFTVTRTTLNGDTLYRRSYSYRPRGFTDAYIESIVARMAPYAVTRSKLDTATVEKALKDAVELPAFQTPISEAVVGEDGSVWLRREDDGGPVFRWLVLDPRGRPVGRFELSRSVSIRWAGMGVFYGVEVDDMGIPWLVRYRVGS